MAMRNNTNTQITAVSSFSGPLPRPEDLAKYNEIVPGAAERILSMAEKEMQHRQEIEKQESKNRISLAHISTVLSFISVLVLSGLIGYSLYLGQFGTAIGVAIGAIASVAGVFVYAKASRNKKE
jgi:uncharacterized membrane protein